jgi:voltage-gated potassium channel
VTQTREARARGPRSEADAEKLARFERVMALPLVLSAVLPLVLLPSGPHSTVAIGVNIAAWLVFLVDFVVHRRLLRGYLHSWIGRFDLVVVILTAPWFLLFGPNQSNLVLLIRLARVARLVMAGKGAHRLIARLGRVFIVAGSVLILASAVAYRAEHPTNPGFKTFGDALWWGIVTLTTVGYGDIVPETTAGRLSGVFLMVTGVAVLGVLAGSLASFFRLAPTSGAIGDEPAGDAAPDQVQELTRHIDRLTQEVARLASKVDDARG